MDAPCHDCTDRQLGCHGRCAVYKVYNNWRTDELKRLAAAKEQVIPNCRSKHWDKVWRRGQK